MIRLEPGRAVKFSYQNWQGKVSVREATFLRLCYGATTWHPEPQWLAEMIDVEKKEERLFALKDMTLL